MSGTHSRAALSVFLAFAILTGLFVAEVLLDEHTSAEISEDANSIASVAAPSIQHLASSRTELRNLEREIGEYVDALAAGHPASSVQVQNTRTAASIELHRYLKLPTYPNEGPLWEALAESDREVTAQLPTLFAAGDRGDVTEARRVEIQVLVPTIERSLEQMNDLIALHSDRAKALAARIDLVHERAVRISRTMTSVCALLAVIVGVVALLNTRRALMELKQDRDRAQTRVDAMDEFSGQVAHDVLGPLVSSEFCWALVRQLYPHDARLSSLAERAHAAHLQTSALVEDLLAFARAGAEPMPGASCQARGVLSVVVDGLRAEADEHEVKLFIDATDAGQVACAPGVLMSIAGNLVRNAVRHMGERDKRVVWVRARAESDVVRIEVEDTGPGVPPELEQRIFLPHVRGTTARGVGLGLGLSTVHRLVTAHKGRVGLKPSAHGGALFWCELPRPDASARERLVQAG